MASSASPEPKGTSAASDSTPRPMWWRALQGVLLVTGLAAVIGSPWWGPQALSHLAFFHVRRVEIEGIRYARTSELMALLKVDTLQSVWQPLEPLVTRAGSHPLVEEVRIERRLPGTLLVRLTEREPVALVERRGQALVPADGRGHLLPIDPVRTPLDVPIASAADSALLHLLGGLRGAAPGIYRRVTRASTVGTTEFRLMLDTVMVRTNRNVTVARVKDILPVEADLARNKLRVVELDLRFRDQVIARQP
ncbi:MAG: FtsQ-type POTRA domain-containing protein [Gemmatimonadaceae bacterium]|nr:FtsQ-type POTRA domain-containing protein [Gemmatimonadaceae bacterium]